MTDSSDHPSITCAENGPYLVKGVSRIGNSRGEPLEAKPTMALCRCGGSAIKPFCDGAHRKNGFTGARQRTEAPTAEFEAYAGSEVTVLDNRSVCAHTGRCTEGLPGVFRLGKEPWIDPNGAPADAIAETVRQCPAGALSYAIDGIEGMESAPDASEPGITVSKDGPYWVVGVPQLSDEVTGQGPQSAGHYALCRCGQSKNKPFCDGAHWSVEFKDDKN